MVLNYSKTVWPSRGFSLFVFGHEKALSVKPPSSTPHLYSKKTFLLLLKIKTIYIYIYIKSVSNWVIDTSPGCLGLLVWTSTRSGSLFGLWPFAHSTEIIFFYLMEYDHSFLDSHQDSVEVKLFRSHFCNSPHTACNWPQYGCNPRVKCDWQATRLNSRTKLSLSTMLAQIEMRRDDCMIYSTVPAYCCIRLYYV